MPARAAVFVQFLRAGQTVNESVNQFTVRVWRRSLSLTARLGLNEDTLKTRIGYKSPKP